MDPIKARVAPANQGDWQRRGRVQVTACVGGRMVTLHLKRGRDGWCHFNLDKAAVAKLDRAERLEAMMTKSVSDLEVAVKKAKLTILLLKKQKKSGVIDEPTYRKDRRKLGKLSREVAAKLVEGQPILEAAKKAADELRAEVPREIQFDLS